MAVDKRKKVVSKILKKKIKVGDAKLSIVVIIIGNKIRFTLKYLNKLLKLKYLSYFTFCVIIKYTETSLWLPSHLVPTLKSTLF